MISTVNVSFIRGSEYTANFIAANPNGTYINLYKAKIYQRVLNADKDVVLTRTSVNPNQIRITDYTTGRYSIFYRSLDTLGLALGTYKHDVTATLHDGNSLVLVPTALFVLTEGGVDAPTVPVVSNTISINHNHGGQDKFQYLTPGGSPISEADVRIYTEEDYLKNKLGSPVGSTMTSLDGRWKDAIPVSIGLNYIIQFFKHNEFGPDTVLITV